MKEDLSSAIIDSMSDGLLVLDSKGYITQINPAAMDKLQVTQEETRVRTYYDLFMDKPQNDAFNDIIFEGIQRRKTRHYGEAMFLRRDGKVLDLAVTTSFLKESMDEAGNHSIVMVFKDITELKSLDRARARVLAHLSHELKTPLSIIMASVKILESPEKRRVIERISRNLERLVEIQWEVEDIVKGKPLEKTHNLEPLAAQALDLLELASDESQDQREVIDLIKDRISRDFRFDSSQVRSIHLAEILEDILQRIRGEITGRSVDLLADLQVDSIVEIDPRFLEKVIMGIIRNAVENTPDGGRIVIGLDASQGETLLSITDTGIGITSESLKQIFGGLYHATETDLYGTKKPYEFGAGGKGLDLLRARIYAQMFGFTIDCSSTRCPYIPEEKDLCPGSVNNCPHLAGPEECHRSGGSVFILRFPRTTDPQQIEQRVSHS